MNECSVFVLLLAGSKEAFGDDNGDTINNLKDRIRAVLEEEKEALKKTPVEGEDVKGNTTETQEIPKKADQPQQQKETGAAKADSKNDSDSKDETQSPTDDQAKSRI